MMNFVIGMCMGVLGIFGMIALIISIEENKKTNRLITKANNDMNKIIKQQELIINELGVDFRKQKQS